MAVTINPLGPPFDFMGSGGGSAGATGPTGAVQYNNGGVFGGDANLTWNQATPQLTVGGNLSVDNGTLEYDATTKRLILSSFSDTGSLNGALILFPFTDPTGLTNQSLLGIHNVLDTDGDSSYASIIGEQTSIQSHSSGTVDVLTGLDVTVRSGVGADVTEATGLYVRMDAVGHNTPLLRGIFIVGGMDVGGAATNVYGIQIDDVTFAGASANAALKIDDQVSSYAIQTGTGVIAFGDEVDMASGKGIKLSTTDPHVAGVLWNNGGLAVISSG